MYRHFYVDAGNFAPFLAKNNMSCLISYAYKKQVIDKIIKAYFIDYPNTDGKILLDSGAFTFSKKGLFADVDTYIRYLNENEKYFFKYIQMDYIPLNDKVTTEQTAEFTLKNYIYMSERLNNKDKLCYVFHDGEPLDFLREALKLDIKNLFIGGLALRHPMSAIQHLDEVYAIIRESGKNPYIHLLGTSMKRLLNRYKVDSSDGSSFIKWSMRGRIHFHVGNGKYFVLHFTDAAEEKQQGYYKLDKRERENFEKRIKELGYDIEEVKKSRELKSELNAIFYEEGFKFLDKKENIRVTKYLF